MTSDFDRCRTTRPVVYRVGQICARVIRWRANDLAGYGTAAGRRRSARRWSTVAVTLAALAVADQLAVYLLRWPNWSTPIQFIAFVALGACVRARGWADGYEARDREGRP